ncbi:MAG: hypothetical protein AAF567_02990 [Actinomycetota bacterium]
MSGGSSARTWRLRTLRVVAVALIAAVIWTEFFVDDAAPDPSATADTELSSAGDSAPEELDEPADAAPTLDRPDDAGPDDPEETDGNRDADPSNDAADDTTADADTTADEDTTADRDTTADADTTADQDDPAGTDNPADSRDDDAGEHELHIERLWSPTDGIARVEGTTTLPADSEVLVMIDGVPLVPVQLVPDSDGVFVVEIDSLATGLRTICLESACEEVFVGEQDDGPPTTLPERLALATEQAETIFDASLHLPGWTVESTGPSNEADGYTLGDDRVVLISANAGRTTSQLTVAVLHEFGHAVDTDYLDDERRDQFRELRGLPPDQAWGDASTQLGDERWTTPADDFAEVFVAWLLGDAYAIRTSALAEQPTDEQLDVFCTLLEIPTLDCSA